MQINRDRLMKLEDAINEFESNPRTPHLAAWLKELVAARAELAELKNETAWLDTPCTDHRPPFPEPRPMPRWIVELERIAQSAPRDPLMCLSEPQPEELTDYLGVVTPEIILALIRYARNTETRIRERCFTSYLEERKLHPPFPLGRHCFCSYCEQGKCLFTAKNTDYQDEAIFDALVAAKLANMVPLPPEDVTPEQPDTDTEQPGDGDNQEPSNPNEEPESGDSEQPEGGGETETPNEESGTETPEEGSADDSTDNPEQPSGETDSTEPEQPGNSEEIPELPMPVTFALRAAAAPTISEESSAETGDGQNPDTGEDAEPDAQPGTSTEGDPTPDPGTGSEETTEPGTDDGDEPQEPSPGEPEPNPDPEPGTDPEPDPGTEPDPEPEPSQDPDPEPDPTPEPEPDQDEHVPNPDPFPWPDEPDFEPDPGTEPGTTPGTEQEPDPCPTPTPFTMLRDARLAVEEEMDAVVADLPQLQKRR